MDEDAQGDEREMPDGAGVHTRDNEPLDSEHGSGDDAGDHSGHGGGVSDGDADDAMGASDDKDATSSGARIAEKRPARRDVRGRVEQYCKLRANEYAAFPSNIARIRPELACAVPTPVQPDAAAKHQRSTSTTAGGRSAPSTSGGTDRSQPPQQQQPQQKRKRTAAEQPRTQGGVFDEMPDPASGKPTFKTKLLGMVDFRRSVSGEQPVGKAGGVFTIRDLEVARATPDARAHQPPQTQIRQRPAEAPEEPRSSADMPPPPLPMVPPSSTSQEATTEAPATTPAHSTSGASPSSTSASTSTSTSTSTSASTSAATQPEQPPCASLSTRWFDEAGGPEFFRNAITYYESFAEREQRTLDGGIGRDSVADGPARVYAEWLAARGAAGVPETAPRPPPPPAATTSSSSSGRDACEVWPAHVAYYLFEATGRERPCCMGVRCISRQCIPHPLGGHEEAASKGKGICGTKNPNRARLGIVLKEFLKPDDRQRLDCYGVLPERHGPCVLCMRCKGTYDSLMAGLGTKAMCAPGHRHPVGLPGGYTREACLQPKVSTTNGIVVPFRRFATNEYVCTTLDMAVEAGIVVLTPTERKALLDEAAKFPAIAGAGGLPRCRGLAERSSVFFFWQTRWLSAQATSLGSESFNSFVVSFDRSRLPPGTQSLPAHERVGATYANDGDIPSLAFGVRRGCWPHLTTEVACRVGVSMAVAEIITGPFSEACRAVRKALLAHEAAAGVLEASTHATTEHHASVSQQQAASSEATSAAPAKYDASSELNDIVRGLAFWETTPLPTPLSAYTILATCALRTETSADIRLTVASDAQIIADRKTRSRLERTEAATIERLRAERPSGECTPQDPEVVAAMQDVRRRILPFPTDTRHQAELKRRVEQLKRRFPPTTSSSSSSTRSSSRKKSAGHRQAARGPTLGDAVDARTGSAMSQRSLDRTISMCAEFEAAHRPLHTALLWMQARGVPTDDASLLGGDDAAFLRCDIGHVDPDRNTIAPWIPRRPIRSQLPRPPTEPDEHAAAPKPDAARQQSHRPARTLPADPGPYRGFPFPAQFATKDVEAVHLVFPSHREAVLGAIVAGAFGDAVSADADAVDLFAGRKQGSSAAVLRVRDLLLEFCDSVAEVARLGEAELRRLVAACAGVADVDRLVDALGLQPGVTIGSRTTLACVVARVALAERLAQFTADRTLRLRLSLFAHTHVDLVVACLRADGATLPRKKARLTTCCGRTTKECAIDRSAHPSGSPRCSGTDDELRAPRRRVADIYSRATSAASDGAAPSIAQEMYPFDNRATSDEDAASICAEISGCGFFDESSDQATSKTMEHIIKKVLPRACEKRHTTRIMAETADLCSQFSMWLGDAVDLFARGAFAHATERPSFTAAVLDVRPLVDEVREDTANRTVAATLRPFVAARDAARAVCEDACVTLLGGDQLSACLDAASAFDAAAGAMDATPSAWRSAPMRAADAAVSRKLCDTIIAETTARCSAPLPQHLRQRLHASLPQVAEACRATTTHATHTERLAAAAAAVAETDGPVAAALYDALLFLRGWCYSSDIEGPAGRDEVEQASKRIARVVTDAVVPILLTASGVECAGRPLDEGHIYGELVQHLVRVRGLPSDMDGQHSSANQPAEGVGADGRFGRKRVVPQQGDDVTCRPAVSSSLVATFGLPLTRGVVVDECVVGVVGASGCRAKLLPDLRNAIEGALRKRGAKHLIAGMGVQIMASLSKHSEDIRDAVKFAKAQMEGAHPAAIAKGAVPVMHRLFGRAVQDDALQCLLDNMEADADGIRESQPMRRAVATVLAAVDVAASEARTLRSTGAAKAAGVLRRYLRAADTGVPSSAKRKGRARAKAPKETADAQEKEKEKEEEKEPASTSTSSATAFGCRSVGHAMLAASAAFGAFLRRAGCIAKRVTQLAAALEEEDRHRGYCRRYALARECLDGRPGVVERRATICRCAVRECVVSAMSRNPALVAAFSTHADWFPEFIDNVTRTCDALRHRTAELGGPPDEDEALRIADEELEETWSGKVYRLQKCDLATRVVKAASKHVEKLVAAGACVPERYVVSEDKAALVHRFVGAHESARSSDPRTDEDVDVDVLWKFGMRDHGIAIVRRLHEAYSRFGGTMEFYAIVCGFSVDEFFLAAEYYAALSVARSVVRIPVCSTDWIESTVSAVQAKYGLAADEFTDQLCHLVVCDSCEAVLTQMSPSTTPTVSKVTSCNKVSSGPDGGHVCFRKRAVPRATTRKPRDEETDADAECKGWGGWEKLVVPDDPTSSAPGYLKTPRDAAAARHAVWCNKPIRPVYAFGRVVEFKKKYKGKGEAPHVHKLPCVMTPCCGTWSRFNFAHWGPPGYLCVNCELTKGTGSVLPGVCAVCGQSASAPAWSRNTQASGDTKDTTGAPRTGSDMRKDITQQQQQQSQQRPTTEQLFDTTLGIDGTAVPVSKEFDHVLVVVDDDATGLPIPVGTCYRCYRVASAMRQPSAGPMFLSTLRKAVETSQIAKESSRRNYERRLRW
jgi:hypothetical protein